MLILYENCAQSTGTETHSDAQNDSDSAIMLEDHVAEVSLSVPNLRTINGSCGSSGGGQGSVGSNGGSVVSVSGEIIDGIAGLGGCEEIIACTNGGNVIKIIRSVSDVVKIRGAQVNNISQINVSIAVLNYHFCPLHKS